MKTIRLIITTTLLVGTATFAVAGPGAQYWQQRRNPPATAKKTVASTDSQKQADGKGESSQPASGCTDCASCKK